MGERGPPYLSIRAWARKSSSSHSARNASRRDWSSSWLRKVKNIGEDGQFRRLW